MAWRVYPSQEVFPGLYESYVLLEWPFILPEYGGGESHPTPVGMPYMAPTTDLGFEVVNLSRMASSRTGGIRGTTEG
ncbi:hypothetical protein PhaeoP128_00145 [Phaeobacter gallaeciensis]|nr:hypothetical protein PhaeoP129_00145 [Phaeobacter gallaeciensis]ATF20924.1 hypothetical protein PhaeoP128_00145 [Phaeobacter gallaeciensis]